MQVCNLFTFMLILYSDREFVLTSLISLNERYEPLNVLLFIIRDRMQLSNSKVKLIYTSDNHTSASRDNLCSINTNAPTNLSLDSITHNTYIHNGDKIQHD